MKPCCRSSSVLAVFSQGLKLLRCKRRLGDPNNCVAEENRSAITEEETGYSQPRILGSRSLSCFLDPIKDGSFEGQQKESIAECLHSARLPEPCPEPSPSHTSCPGTESEIEPEPSEILSRQAASRPSLPSFQKPTCEVRLRKLHEEIHEFCELDFDQVEPEQQSGLACRMLVLLKSLRRNICYWENGVRSEMPAFELLELTQADMSLLRLIVRRAEERVDGNRWRQAYQELCRARPIVTQKEEQERFTGRPEPSLKPWRKHARQSEEKTASHLCSPVKADEVRRSDIVSKGSNSSPNKSRTPQPGQGSGYGRAGGGKYLCRLKVGIEEDPHFQVCRRIIGPGGENMKRIIGSVSKDGCVKLRLRGRGSKYLEGPEDKESSDPLMLCVSATSRKSFDRAAQDVENLLAMIHEDYRLHCKAVGQTASILPLRREGQRSR